MTFLAPDHLDDPAQHELTSLRSKMLNRLELLEAVLADPSRGESLAGVILDLSRIATDEAQAAAAEACRAIRTEADRQMAELRESAKTALDAAQTSLRAANESLAKERSASADLRREIEQAQLELHKQHELLKAREEYEEEIKSARVQLEEELNRTREQMGYEVDRQQAIATELAREREAALAELRTNLENERTANAELRWTLERTEAKIAAIEREHEEARALHDVQRSAIDQVQSELERERTSIGDLQSERSRLEARVLQLEAEHGQLQAELSRLQSMADELQAANAGLQIVNSELESANSELQSSNSELLSTNGDLQNANDGLQETNERLLKALESAGEQSAELDEASRRLNALAAERDAIAAELLTAQNWIRELRAAEAEFAAMSHSGPAHSVPPPAPQSAPAPARTPDAKDGWQPIQLANRHVFKEPVTVDVNGAAAGLVDISVSGCQLVTEVPLKPHQTLKVVLTSTPLLACAGRVVWTRVESSAGGRLAYRAGVRFSKPDEAAIEEFAARHMGTA